MCIYSYIYTYVYVYGNEQSLKQLEEVNTGKNDLKSNLVELCPGISLLEICIKVSAASMLMHHRLTFSQRWRLEVKDQCVSRIGPSLSASDCGRPPSLFAFLWPFHWAFASQFSLLIRIPCLLGWGPPWWLHFNLMASVRGPSRNTVTTNLPRSSLPRLQSSSCPSSSPR